MQVSLNWLNEFVDLSDIEVEQVAHELTMSGLEVEAVEELKRMWDRGMTTGQLAKALNVTKNSIIGKVHRLCLTARPSPIKKVSETSEKKSTHTEKSPKSAKAVVPRAKNIPVKTPIKANNLSFFI